MGRVQVWAAAGVALVVIWIALLTMPTSAVVEGVDHALSGLLLQAASAGLAIAIGALCFVRWRMTGDAASLLIGVAAFLLGIVSTTLGYLLPLATDVIDHVAAFAWLRPVSRIAVVGLFAAALVVPPVDTRLRPGRLLAASVLLVGAVTIAVQASPDLGTIVAALDTTETRSFGGSVALVSAWGLLAVGYLVRARAQRSLLFGWFALLLLGFAMSEVVLLLHGPDVEALLVLRVVRTLGVAAGLVGALYGVERAFAAQSDRLLQTVIEAGAAQARIRSWEAADDERAHEAVNALAAIAGASRTLHHFHDRLDPETREGLVTALGGEIGRLQHLLRRERGEQPVLAFHLLDVLAPQIASARARGADIDADLPDLRAIGRPNELSQVVANLIENAMRYAPDSRIAVGASRHGNTVQLRVADRGPGVPAEERESVFNRGVRGSKTLDVAGTGLGLYVSALLMREQGGDLYLDDADEEGAVFVVVLPAPDDEPDDVMSAMSGASGVAVSAVEAGPTSGPGGRDVESRVELGDEGEQVRDAVEAPYLRTRA